MYIIKRSLLHASWLVTLILVFGASIGAVAGLTATTVDDAGKQCAQFYPLLAVILPLGVWGSTLGFLRQDEDLYANWSGAMGIPILAGVFGALFARLGYVWIAGVGAVILSVGKFDPYTINRAIQVNLSGLAFLGVLVTTLLGTALVGVWAHKRANRI
ncbi:hypothetical protein EKD04_019205 [Chloroflexales bacterium ZM16-3]|nr:hypothetical protein [Chloroflexales bacterium ZM16-3]